MNKLLIQVLLMTALTVAGLASAASPPLRGTRATAPLIYSGSFTLPLGTSEWDVNFSQPVGASPLLISYSPTSQCPTAPLLSVSVKPLATGVWEGTNEVNGLLYYSGGTITDLHLSIIQNNFQNELCTLNVYQAIDPSSPGDPGSDTLVGAIDYAGGFAQDLKVAITSPNVVTQVRIDTPAFCTNVNILELSTVSNGGIIKASLLAKANGSSTYLVNGEAGNVISQIQATLNGPADNKCTLPVYILEQTAAKAPSVPR